MSLVAPVGVSELDVTDAERGELDAVAGQSVRRIVKQIVGAVEPSTTAPAAVNATACPRRLQPGTTLELRATYDRVIDQGQRRPN